MSLGRVAWVALEVFAFVLLLGAVALVVAPVFMQLDTYGIHDWDQMEAHRYLAIKTLREFHQFPFWNPYSCGGHTWWGGLESGSSIVSLWAPFYLLLPLPWALRLEVVGSALLGAVGAWLLASRFTRSPAWKLLVAVAFAVNGRFALQASMGHTWHLAYAWTPWALYFLDRAIAMAPSLAPPRSPLRDVVAAGVCLAMMVYMGGIYPLPQTVLVIACYAISCAWTARSMRPVWIAVASGLVSFGLSAPRLLPVLDTVRRYPRLVDSPEVLDVAGLVGVFTAKEGAHPAVSPWGYHEFGIYTGWVPFCVMIAGLLLAARARERALRVAGAVCLVLGLGRFSTYAPWALLHDHVPVFESQHVPSRWLYPAALLLLVAGASIAERYLAIVKRRGLLEFALVFGAAWVALDVGLEAQRPLVGAFVRHLPLHIQAAPQFHQEKVAPQSLHYDVPDWTPPAMPSMMGNVGNIDCATFPGLGSYFRDHEGKLPGLGAKGRGEPGYRGEVYFANGRGYAGILTWSPNAVSIHYAGVTPGDVLVMNQNFDAGWHPSEGTSVNWNDLIAVRVDQASGDLTLAYRPPWLVAGLLIFCATVLGLMLYQRRATHG